MAVYQHSVSLDTERCRGCTSCLRQCPTEAIRILGGHAVIDADRCIDCGKCIRVCPHKAKKAVFDKLDSIDPKYRWRIALPAPTLFGQFEETDDVGCILQALLDCGFDDVFEVARGAEIVSECTRRYMRRKDIPRPVISASCPAILRLIQIRFPYLCDHILPILSPMEIAGKLAKEEALRKHPELHADEICTVFISPCPAKASDIKNNDRNESNIDYVVSMSEIFFQILEHLKPSCSSTKQSSASILGISWAASGGEATALFQNQFLAADGMENAIQVLDELETDHFPHLEFVELTACPGGCVGGASAVENPYIAKARLQSLRWKLPVSKNRAELDAKSLTTIPQEFLLKEPIRPLQVMRLSDDRGEAMRMMSEIENLHQMLPRIDCGSCGAPTCEAFAEDVVKGIYKIEDCAVYLRRHGCLSLK